MFSRPLFVFLYFFFWPLWCLFFLDIQILIASFVLKCDLIRNSKDWIVLGFFFLHIFIYRIENTVACMIWKINFPFGCILHTKFDKSVIKGRLVCFNIQHTNSQLETFWTLQVRVVILHGELYQATWYTMDGLNCKRYLRNPILIESAIYIILI